MALSALFFSWMSLLVKLAGQAFGTMELVFARAVVVSVLSLAILVWRRTPLHGARWGFLILRGVLGLVALTMFYFSVVHLPLAEATVIHFTNPVFTAVLAAIFLGERLHGREFALTLASLAGVAIIVRPRALLLGGPDALDPHAVASSLGAALFAAGAYVMVRRLRDHDTFLVVFSFAAVSVVATTPLIGTFRVPAGEQWALLAGVGLATFLGQVFLTRGLKRERAGRATTVGYLQIVFATAWGVVVFGEMPRWTTLLGALVVVGSTLLLARLRDSSGSSGGSGAPEPDARPRASEQTAPTDARPPAAVEPSD